MATQAERDSIIAQATAINPSNPQLALWQYAQSIGYSPAQIDEYMGWNVGTSANWAQSNGLLSSQSATPAFDSTGMTPTYAPSSATDGEGLADGEQTGFSKTVGDKTYTYDMQGNFVSGYRDAGNGWTAPINASGTDTALARNTSSNQDIGSTLSGAVSSFGNAIANSPEMMAGITAVAAMAGVPPGTVAAVLGGNRTAVDGNVLAGIETAAASYGLGTMVNGAFQPNTPSQYSLANGTGTLGAASQTGTANAMAGNTGLGLGSASTGATAAALGSGAAGAGTGLTLGAASNAATNAALNGATLASTLGSGLGGLTSGIGTNIGNLTSGIGTGLGNLTGGISSGLGGLTGGIGTNIGNLTSGIGTGLGNLSTGINSGLGTLGTGLGNLTSNIGTGLGNLTSGIGSGLEGLFTGVSSGLSGLTSGLTSTLNANNLAATAATTAGAALNAEAARAAAQTQADAQIRAAQIAADAAKFKPVGVTTNFGSSRFGYDANGNLTSAGYQLSPELQAALGQLGGQAQGLLTQAGQARSATAPMATAAQRAMQLGQGYLATDPKAQAQKYLNDQLGLLAPSRASDMAAPQAQMQAQGRGGFAIGGGVGGQGAANPQLQALLNAQLQQNAQLAANATQGGMDYAKFGTGMVGTGGDLLSSMYGTQNAAYDPFKTAMGAAQNIEGLGQNALEMGINLGGRTTAANTNAGNLLSGGMTSAANTVGQTNQTLGSNWGNMLSSIGNTMSTYRYDPMTGRPL